VEAIEKGIEVLDEEEGVGIFEAKMAQNCSTSFSYTGEQPPCPPPEHIGCVGLEKMKKLALKTSGAGFLLTVLSGKR